MATRSLSPKRALEKMQQHRHAVAVLARQAAIKAVKRQLQAQGIKPYSLSIKRIRALADDYLAEHRERLVADARQIIATSPLFAQWRCPVQISTTMHKRRFLGPEAVVGELSMIDGLPRSASVVAVRPAVLSFLSRAAFESFTEKHPKFCKYLVTLLSARLRETDVTIAAGSFLQLKGRLACTLLELADEFGQDIGYGRTVIRQKIAQSDLASMTGIARESASRIISDWQRCKMISRLSGYYCIENKDQLQREAEL